MSKLQWACPHCSTTLETDEGYAQSRMTCCKCNGESVPLEVLIAPFVALVQPLVHQKERIVRQHLREFRSRLRDAIEPELMDLLIGLNNAEILVASTAAKRLFAALCNEVEDELDARVNETSWNQAKRLARRGTRTTVEWLKTEDGKNVAKTAAVIAGLLGLGIWTS